MNKNPTPLSESFNDPVAPTEEEDRSDDVFESLADMGVQVADVSPSLREAYATFLKNKEAS